MSSDDEIPVLRDAVARKPRPGLNAEQIDDLCDSLNAKAWVLIDKLVGDALQEVEDALRLKINDRLSEELPELIEDTVREKLGLAPDES
ncbi:MAG: hypothetical protein QF790_07690 [Gammaproteobacteria bacterium]|jgi:hypothetical protein|nr:hypothetical protein [Gammaproteobacteria bacterium]MDP6617028.1 hypothetical protein [Gammaproteobacteria bacterium]MDP6695080.1 hypothetical protein [Gammaproteobacteria bacterium]